MQGFLDVFATHCGSSGGLTQADQLREGHLTLLHRGADIRAGKTIVNKTVTV